MNNVFQCSWQSLLEAVLDAKETTEGKDGFIDRIFDDILMAFSIHKEYYFKYLDSVILDHTNIQSDYKLFPNLI